ncbi:MAG: hypothetical protein LGL72_10390 [Acidibrevibacterium sp.]|uniref:hypothetical protein n=1 Tax=Acidibrevibacterium fodinaquatile TaxID=1969806 RepID=UPI0013B44D21|nr:hypothetical protein [Acidibrevibacterium fodinaquatile]MCA7119794.1 hypothetical protein [Acidibrevibacterium fodinaquatile]
MTPRFSRPWRMALFSLSTVLALDSCGAPYAPKPIEMEPPDSAPDLAQIPGTDIKMSSLFYNNPETLRNEFSGKHGLWRGHVVVTQLTISSDDKNPTDVLIDSAYISINHKYYPAISPKEVYDVAWPAANPHAPLKEDLFNAAVVGFTVLTLGLGSVIWVLPTPFSQPAPDSTPFGRDLNYKALTNNITLQPGTFRSGFLFFHLPQSVDMNKLDGAQMVLHFVTKTPNATPHEIIFNLPPPAKPAS